MKRHLYDTGPIHALGVAPPSRDYTPPPPHHRHTRRVHEPAVPVAHGSAPQLTATEAARRQRQMGLGRHTLTTKDIADRHARLHGHSAK